MPSFSNNNTPSVAQLHSIVAFIKSLLEALEARIDIQVTATTEPDADYAAEVLDGRVDALGNEHGSLGANIREGQRRLTLGLRAVQQSHQEQIDSLSNAVLGLSATLAETLETRRLETRRLETQKERESRIDGDAILQKQIDTLSSAVLDLTTTIAELREAARNS